MQASEVPSIAVLIGVNRNNIFIELRCDKRPTRVFFEGMMTCPPVTCISLDWILGVASACERKFLFSIAQTPTVVSEPDLCVDVLYG